MIGATGPGHCGGAATYLPAIHSLHEGYVLYMAL